MMIKDLRLFIALCLCFIVGTTTALTTPTTTSRRSFFTNAATAAATAALVVSSNPSTIHAVEPSTAAVATTFQAYQVLPDASAALNPTLRNVSNKNWLSKLSRIQSGSIWLGEHHNSVKDHVLQNDIIRRVHAARTSTNRDGISPKGPHNMAIGLEQVQMQYQPVLDDYLAGNISIQQLKDGVEWEKAWQWPFEGYAPIFETAFEFQIPLVALNVNSQDLQLVENGGLPNLPPALLQQYIPDRKGFAAFAKTPSFPSYVDYVIRPSYDLHEALGLLDYSMSGAKLDQKLSFRNFFSSRILWDECMATRAYEWTSSAATTTTNENSPRSSKNGRLLIGLVGADHVKLEQGIPGRFARMQASSAQKGDSVSVLLNPTLSDTRPAASVDAMMANNVPQRVDQLTLQLRYLNAGVAEDQRSLPSSTGGVLSLADYLLVN